MWTVSDGQSESKMVVEKWSRENVKDGWRKRRLGSFLTSHKTVRVVWGETDSAISGS